MEHYPKTDVPLKVMDKVIENGSRIPIEVARGACRRSFAQSGPTCFYAMIAKYFTGMGARKAKGPFETGGSCAVEGLNVSNGIEIPPGKFHELWHPTLSNSCFPVQLMTT